MFFLDTIWLIPVFPLLGAALMTLLGRLFDPQHEHGPGTHHHHHHDHGHDQEHSSHHHHGLRWIISFLCPGMVLLSFLWSVGAVVSLDRRFEKISFTWVAGLPFTLDDGRIAVLSADWGFLLDPVSAVMILIVTGIGFLIHVYSVAYMAHDGGYYRYFGYLNLFLFFMLTLVLANNYLLLFAGWEGVGLASYLLIGFYFKRKPAGDAANKAFLMNRVGDAGYLLALLFLFAIYGTVRFTQMPAAAHPLLGWVTVLLLAAATGKSAQIPLFTWLPDAMEGPTPVSALIHAATMVTAGVYLVVRSAPLFDLTPAVGSWMAIVGAATAILAATIALVQTDIKKVLAYSTVSQLGLMFLALGVGAYWVALFHVLTHAFFKAQLFLGAGAVIHALDGEQDMQRMGGLRHRMPQTFRTMVIGSLALSGWPGLAGFFSKDEILIAAWNSCGGLFAIGLFTSFLTAIYMGRLLFLTFFGEYAGTVRVHEAPARMTLPLWALSIGSVSAGWFGPALARWLGVPPPTHNWVIPTVAALAALTGSAVAYALYIARPGAAARLALAAGPFTRLLHARWYINAAYHAVFVRGLALGGGRLLNRLDNGVVDGVVNGAGWCTRAAGEVSGWWDTWVVDGAVRLTAFSVRLASFPVRLLQTGAAQSYALVLVLSLAAFAGWYLMRSA